jgi:hypothetical protein
LLVSTAIIAATHGSELNFLESFAEYLAFDKERIDVKPYTVRIGDVDLLNQAERRKPRQGTAIPKVFLRI